MRRGMNISGRISRNRAIQSVLVLGLVLSTLVFTHGCQKSASSTEDATTDTGVSIEFETPAAPQEKADSPDGSSQPPDASAGPDVTDASADAPTDASQEASPTFALASIPQELLGTLGLPELTAGIAAESPLSVDQIRAWLDNPRQHETLEVVLPMGLQAAVANVKGVDKNPLTRAKIELGRQLYFDRRLSADNTVSCADCHHPDDGYGRHTQFGVGINGQMGNRNSPVSYNRILSGPQFWDGRAASLEEQAVGPIANPIEMGNTHEAAVATVRDIEGYRLQFEKVFPDDGVTIETIGKALTTFERVLVSYPSPYDYYEIVSNMQAQYAEDEIAELEQDEPELFARYQWARSESSNMSESAIRGRTLFFSEKAACTACHAGANFTDELYHNLGVGMDQESPDPGRMAVTKLEKDRGAFKTPTLRNVALSAPYMHDGSQKTLEEVVEWYAKGGHPNPQLSEKVKKLDLTDQDKKDLVAFMHSLSGGFAPVQTGGLP